MRQLIITLLFVTGIAFASSSEKTIAGKAIALSSKLLSQNIEDEDGLAFYKLAKALTPESDMVMLIGGYLKKNKAPRPLSGSVPKAQLLKEIRERGRDLVKNRFKKNRAVGDIALLLLRFSEKFDRKDEAVLYALVYLNTYGYTDELDALYEKSYRLDAVSKSGKKPSKAVDLNLSKKDEAIADYSIKLGRMLLASDRSSAEGMNWARLGHHLNPSDSKGLMTLKQVERGMTIKASKTSVTSGKLVKELVERAELHLKKAKKDSVAGHLAQLYYKMADAVKPDQKSVLIGLMRLEQMELEGSLDELLDSNLSDLMPLEAGDDDDDDDDDDDVADKTAINGSKIRPKVKSRKKSVSGSSSYYKREMITVSGKIDNYTGQDVSGLIIECYIIASNDNRTEFLIAHKSVNSPVSIKTRMWYNVPELSGTFYKRGNSSSSYTRHYYYSWLVVIKDSSGKVLNSDSTNSTIKKLADKIVKFRASRVSSSTYSSSSSSYYSGTRFSKTGNVLSSGSSYSN